MPRLLGILALSSALLLAWTPAAWAQAAPHCPPGQAPDFDAGFATLKSLLGETMGQPVECAHPNSANGDILQQTTAGLAFWRKATNTPTFTDGVRHWALTAQGLVTWTGDSIDPPAGASSAASPSGGAPGGASGTADVVLDVPELSVQELNLTVQDLQADIALHARAADLVRLNAGVHASVQTVELTIRGVDGEVHLTVRLDEVTKIISRLMTTLDRNPDLLQNLTGALSEGLSATEGSP